jgi:RHS repeat-associated protein
VKAGGNKVDYVGKQQKVFDGIVKNLKFLGADGQVLTAGKSGKVPPGQINGSGNVAEPFRYFYHPDHLGSTSYVTDASGEVFQHMEYFAFGETFVEEHSNTDKTPYLFNGKELDEETGLYYYGARYYDARVSVWQSVDPMAFEHTNTSPYAYVYNNPIRLIDQVGMDSTQRANALAQAQNYIDQKASGNQYLMGAKKWTWWKGGLLRSGLKRCSSWRGNGP